jgi:esterase/lipase superfamily enzyme
MRPRDSLQPAASLQPVYYATNRKIDDGDKPLVERITSDRGTLTYGLAVVSVPKTHRIGNIERPEFSYLRWAYEPERDDKHFVLKPLAPLSRDALIEGLRSRNDSILLFIHGYRNSFSDAIFKAAQIAYDANFPGSVLAFSWPSANALLGYDYDTVSAGYSTSDLLELMKLVSQEAGGKRVYVVAHSMGNQIVTNALVQAKLSNFELGISELVMAAPDVDKDTFFKVANDIKSVAQNVTMYASAADKALLASEKKSWASRMGYVGASGPHLIDWIETIDVTAVGEDMFGLNHSKFSENRAVLEDLARIISSLKHAKPNERNGTLRAEPNKENVKYWRYAR